MKAKLNADDGTTLRRWTASYLSDLAVLFNRVADLLDVTVEVKISLSALHGALGAVEVAHREVAGRREELLALLQELIVVIPAPPTSSTDE